jgi:tRNA pseudouridine38-40 synthase
MARYKVVLAYDGSEFFGSQRQAEARTVQSVFEIGLQKLGWQGQSILLAGRTDSGVHASGQVVAFDLPWKHPPDALLRALNAVLPKDIAAREVTECLDDFHPRFGALSRRYRYEIRCDPVRDPLKERYTWRVWPAPDFDLLLAAAGELIGIHDFAPFGSATSPDGSTIREVQQALWKQQGPRLTFEVTANAFLYHMVRRMVFVQVSVGQGKLEAGIISRVLQAPHSYPIFQGLAPSQGLSLVEVNYPTEDARITNQEK